MADLRRVWRRDPQEFGYLDEDDLRAIERGKRASGVLLVLCALAVVTSYVAAGFAGLVASLSGLAVLGLIPVALGLPVAPPRRRRRRRRPPSFDQRYPTFQHVREQLSWSQVSPRHYDMVTRPLLVRLMASRLADHHGIDLYRSPERARAVVGEDVWWWLDPARAIAGSSQPPGVDVRTLTRLVERLEKL